MSALFGLHWEKCCNGTYILQVQKIKYTLDIFYICFIVNSKLNESLRYIVLNNHAYLSAFWFINNKKLNSMPEDLRVIVLDIFEDMRNYLSSYTKYKQIRVYNEFKSKSGVIYNPS